MRGVVFDGKRVQVVDDLAVRDPGPGEVLVAVAAAGLCHSDLSVVGGTILWSQLGAERAPVVTRIPPAPVLAQLPDLDRMLHQALSVLNRSSSRRCSIPR